MSVRKRTFVFVVLALLVWSVVATSFAGYYYSTYSDLLGKTYKSIIHVNIGINYGNGTVEWFNGTEARAGDTLSNVTMRIANYTVDPSGAFVNSINGVSYSGSYYWIWWMWTTWGWFDGKVGADRYAVGDGEILCWYYEDTLISPLPKPS
jgi:hypothetical protein